MKMPMRCTVKTSLLFALITTATYSSMSLAQDMSATNGPASLAQGIDPAAPTERMSYHDNYVYFTVKTSGYTLQGGTYKTTDRSITSGQDPDGKNDPPHSYEMNPHEGSFGFTVGRKGSGQVASWFSSFVGPNNNTFGHNPDDLNFAFRGNLSLTIEGSGLDRGPVNFPDIFIAQGKAVGNNWWFGGTRCTTQKSGNRVECQSDNYPSKKFVFQRGGEGNNNTANDVFVYIE